MNQDSIGQLTSEPLDISFPQSPTLVKNDVNIERHPSCLSMQTLCTSHDPIL
jgi:hypothetical protein